MNKRVVDGYEKIENDFGYWPSFHDDIIDKIEISSEGIIFFIRMQTFPKDMNSYPIIKLIFYGVEKFYLEGEAYGCASIIFNMESQEIDDCIETQISSSLGAGGSIRCNKIKIELI